MDDSLTELRSSVAGLVGPQLVRADRQSLQHRTRASGSTSSAWPSSAVLRPGALRHSARAARRIRGSQRSPTITTVGTEMNRIRSAGRAPSNMNGGSMQRQRLDLEAVGRGAGNDGS